MSIVFTLKIKFSEYFIKEVHIILAHKYTDFGLEVRSELLRQNKNMRYLAKMIGCSDSFLSDMLRGNRRLISSRGVDWGAKIKGVLYDEARGTEITKEIG